jgi:CubicO group peptidase (beta-lactamase class C family)
VAAVTALLMSCQVGRLVWYNFADLNDHEKFPSRPLTASEAPFTFYTTNRGKFPKHINQVPFDQYLEDQKTVAFLIIRRDTIQYEQYFKGYDQASIVPSFSMAKSVTSILIGCALDDGLIQSVDEPITRYIPELAPNGFDKVTIEHVLQMTSGLKFNESYSNPFGEAGAFYYGVNLRKQTTRLKLKHEPGQQFDYVSGNTQLLGLVLERALNGKTITAYLQEKLWTPLAMEYDASWSIDREEDGLEKTFCCLNARARDFAKLGRLYKNKGNWNGTQIVSPQWVATSTQLDTTAGSAPYYQYQWWLPNPGEDFMAEGILGQFVYVHPDKDLIIVRLGHTEGNADWWGIFTALAEGY